MDIAWRIWRSRWTVFLAGIGFTLTIPIVFYETKLYAEALAVTLVVVLLWQMAARGRPWLAGLTCGLLILTRPETALFSAVVAFYAWRVERPEGRRRRIAGVVGIVLVCLAVASRRNSLIADVFVATPSVTSGVAFYIGNNPSAEGGYSQPEGFVSTVVGQSQEAKDLAERTVGHPLDPVAVSRQRRVAGELHRLRSERRRRPDHRRADGWRAQRAARLPDRPLRSGSVRGAAGGGAGLSQHDLWVADRPGEPASPQWAYDQPGRGRAPRHRREPRA
jgi:hypothetical protein